jgi:hypothetical protein
MSNATGKLPSFCNHRATGQAVVRLSGKDIYLGPHGSAAAKAEYDRLVAVRVSLSVSAYCWGVGR